MGKWINIIAILCIIIIFIIGCERKEETMPIQIGMTFDSFVIERWQKDRDVFVATAKELGAQVNVQIANGKVEEQIEQIQYFIEKKMDVVVVIATDSDALSEVLKAAKEEGIKVIAYDRLIYNANVDLYISFDNEEVGRLMADTLIQENPEGGNIIAIYGSNVDHNVSMVVRAFEEELQNTGLNISYSSYAEGWIAEQAFTTANEGLEQGTNIVGVMCGNDDLASQAIRALSEKRLAGKVSLVGQDADLLACQRIVEWTQSMTVYKPVEQLAKAAAEYAVWLANGEKLEGLEQMNDGTYEVPYERLKPIPVTAENMEQEILKSGFHDKEDVYLNATFVFPITEQIIE